MFDVAGPLMNALNAARDALQSQSAATADSQTPFGSARSETAMAAVAQRAVFSETLMNALHARLAEIKAVTHS